MNSLATGLSAIGDWKAWSGVCEFFGWTAIGAGGCLVVPAFLLVLLFPARSYRDQQSETVAIAPDLDFELQDDYPREFEMPSPSFEEQQSMESGGFADNSQFGTRLPEASFEFDESPDREHLNSDRSPENTIAPPPFNLSENETPAGAQKALPEEVKSVVLKAEDRLREFGTALTAAVSPKDRVSAADEIGKLKPNNREIIAELIDALDDASPDVRRAVARSLGEIGKPAGDAIPTLFRLVREERDNNVRGESAVAMIKIDADCEQVKDCLRMTLVGGTGTRIRNVHGGVITANRIWACEQIHMLGERARWAEYTIRELVLQVALHVDVDRNAELFDKSVQALIAIKARDTATLGAMRKLRDGKGILTVNADRLAKVKVSADSCVKAIEAAKD